MLSANLNSLSVGVQYFGLLAASTGVLAGARAVAMAGAFAASLRKRRGAVVLGRYQVHLL